MNNEDKGKRWILPYSFLKVFFSLLDLETSVFPKIEQQGMPVVFSRNHCGELEVVLYLFPIHKQSLYDIDEVVVVYVCLGMIFHKLHTGKSL